MLVQNSGRWGKEAHYTTYCTFVYCKSIKKSKQLPNPNQTPRLKPREAPSQDFGGWPLQPGL